MINKGALLIILVVSVVISLGVGVYVGWTVRDKDVAREKAIVAEATLENAKEKLREEGQIREETASLSGVVKSIRDNEIDFEANLVNPLQDESLSVRTAVVTDETEIVILIPKAKEKLESDREEYREKRSSLENELGLINSQLKSCGVENGVRADDIREVDFATVNCNSLFLKQEEVNDELRDINRLMSEYESEEGEVQDIKPGFIINAEIEKGGNIAENKKFEAKYIQAGKEAQKIDSGELRL